MSDNSTTKYYTNLLIANYLKYNGLEDSFAAFIRETALPLSALEKIKSSIGNVGDVPLEDLQTVIEDRIHYKKLSFKDRFKTLSINDDLAPVDNIKYGIQPWNHDLKFSINVNLNRALPNDMLFISAKFTEDGKHLLLSSATGCLIVYDVQKATSKALNIKEKIKSIVKLYGYIGSSGYQYLCSMNGFFYLLNKDFELVPNAAWRIHTRMITHIKICRATASSWFIITSGMDNFLRLSLLEIKDAEHFLTQLSEVRLASNCTSLNVIANCDNGDGRNKFSVFLTRAEFTHITCYSIKDARYLVHSYNIALNNAEFSTYAFNVRDVIVVDFVHSNNKETIKLTASTILVVATSHKPYMRLILVEVPMKTDQLKSIKSGEVQKTYYDKVLRNFATEICQDDFSLPILRKLKYSNGILVGNDDGIYGVDLMNGDSRLLNIPDKPNILRNRIKCMDVTNDQMKVVAGVSTKSIYILDVIENSH
ncbi:hypothetical protein SMKI_06G1560 [Saccharomyces mikatae IFO 1815]|uniref:LisH domain-containing protein n=1 Tax=Saccharomyces mikatae IFO 1815 TaxID=226126 RepID=A0AA35NHB0_SACMI|nr:uncharacterized protein SMKI_06G1560 [Saccharomyces mikatae IFO 1815]CAI4038808.1 hypothetical protein SMKI_06G1560 [Saccharomyces mikatae IFO 1815]